MQLDAMDEREAGAILEAVSQLSSRVERIDQKLDKLQESFLRHPLQCVSEMERRFVNRSEFEDVQSWVRQVKSFTLVTVLTALAAAAAWGIKLSVGQ